MQLEGKRIIVTGGARGIGAGTVRGFVREGAQVAVLDVADDLAAESIKEANAQGAGKATYYHCDISKPDEVFSAFDKAAAQMGGLDVLAHIAAIEGTRNAEDFTLEEANRMWSININGTIFTNQAACKLMMQQRKGAIINFASDTYSTGMPFSATYAASKGAVVSWTRTIAYEWAIKYNLRSNCICPTIKTPMYEQWMAQAKPEELKAHLESNKRRYPIGGGLGDVDRDMVPVMVFLATDGSGYINGQIIAVNGGMNFVR